MKRIFQIGLAVLLVICLAGCCACRYTQQKMRKPLMETEWRMIQLEGESLAAQGGRYTIVFHQKDHSLTGMGSVNRLMANFETDEKQGLKIGAVATTRKAGPEMEKEWKMVEALQSTTHFDMDGEMLLLLSDKGIVAVFEAVTSEKVEK